jgi:hypothetical protein
MAAWDLRVEGIVLGLDRPALARIPVAREALGDEAGHAQLARGGQQRVGALGPQPVRRRERLIEVAREASVLERRGLVDDRLRLCLGHGPADRARVEQVERERRRVHRHDRLGVAGRAVGADHLVPAVDQLPREPQADRTARSHHQYAHVRSSVRSHPAAVGGLARMTRGDGGT